eukprot:tig00020941_g16229.t2
MAVKSPIQVWNALSSAGLAKTQLNWQRQFVLGILAGCFIAFGGLSAVTVGLGALHFAAVFPVGLVLVVLTGAELVTGNFMAMVVLVLERPRSDSLRALARNWAVVWLGNLVGSIALAYFLCFLGGLFNDPTYRDALRGLAEKKGATTPLGQIFVRAIGCNWLVCLAIWDKPERLTRVSRKFPIATFVIVGFEHSVANMFFLPLGYFYGAQVTWAQILFRNLFTVTIGNIIGGGLFCAGVFYYTVARHPPNVAASAAASAAATAAPSTQRAAAGDAPRKDEGTTTPLGSVVRHYPAKDGRTIRVELRADVLEVLEAGRAGTPLRGAEAELEYLSFGNGTAAAAGGKLGAGGEEAERGTAEVVDGFLRALVGRFSRDVSVVDVRGAPVDGGGRLAAPPGPPGGAGAPPPLATTDVA